MTVESAHIARALERWEEEMAKIGKFYLFPAQSTPREQQLFWKILQEERLKSPNGRGRK